MTISAPFARIYHIVSQIPKGRVLTYKDVAILAGVNSPRVVGLALHRNSNPKQIPCHRVVNNKGELARGYAFGGAKKHKERLSKEGIEFTKGKVLLATYSAIKFFSDNIPGE